MTVLWVLIGLLVGAAGAVLAYRPVLRRFSLERETWRQEAAQREEQVGTLRDQLSGQAVQLTEAAVRQATLAEKLAARDEALTRQKEELTALQERQRVEFKNLAAEILEEKSNQFKQTNRESLELLLKPFRDNIEGFRKKVEEVYEKEAQQRFSLKEEIRHLNEMNLRMSQEANNLTAALKEFFTANKLPMNRVALIAGGSQFMHRILSLPAMSEKKRMAVLSHELASGGAEVRAPLDDYMLLSRDAKTRVDTVLATRVEQSVIAGYDALAKAVGFKLYSIDLGLAAPIKAVRTIPDLQQKTFVLLQFDDDTISACLFVQGQYTYSTRSRLFNPRGSAESGTEIAQKLSGLIQFHTTSKSEHRIETVCFAGSTADDLAVCRPGCEALGLQVDRFPDSPTVRLPSGTALADVLYAAGNLIAR